MKQTNICRNFIKLIVYKTLWYSISIIFVSYVENEESHTKFVWSSVRGGQFLGHPRASVRRCSTFNIWSYLPKMITFITDLPLEILFDIIKSLEPSSALSNLALCSRRLYNSVVPFLFYKYVKLLSIDANEASFPLRKLIYLFLRRSDLAQNKFSKESVRKAFIESTAVCCSSISFSANIDVKAKKGFNNSKIERE